MAINRINKSQFDEFNPPRSETIQQLTEERAWFADSSNNVAGTVLLDKTDEDWSYVVLGRDERGDFRCIDMKVSLPIQADAERELQGRMQEYERSGQTVFPQGD
jgi:hypothetical protein